MTKIDKNIYHNELKVITKENVLDIIEECEYFTNIIGILIIEYSSKQNTIDLWKEGPSPKLCNLYSFYESLKTQMNTLIINNMNKTRIKLSSTNIVVYDALIDTIEDILYTLKSRYFILLKNNLEIM